MSKKHEICGGDPLCGGCKIDRSKIRRESPTLADMYDQALKKIDWQAAQLVEAKAVIQALHERLRGPASGQGNSN